MKGVPPTMNSRFTNLTNKCSLSETFNLDVGFKTFSNRRRIIFFTKHYKKERK
jgi:hypothetical protein